jgi:hypothetical protein
MADDCASARASLRVTTGSGMPHSAQYRLVRAFSAMHFGQRITVLPVAHGPSDDSRKTNLVPNGKVLMLPNGPL